MLLAVYTAAALPPVTFNTSADDNHDLYADGACVGSYSGWLNVFSTAIPAPTRVLFLLTRCLLNYSLMLTYLSTNLFTFLITCLLAYLRCRNFRVKTYCLVPKFDVEYYDTYIVNLIARLKSFL